MCRVSPYSSEHARFTFVSKPPIGLVGKGAVVLVNGVGTPEQYVDVFGMAFGTFELECCRRAILDQGVV